MPSVSAVLAAIKADGLQRLVVMPLYPQVEACRDKARDLCCPPCGLRVSHLAPRRTSPLPTAVLDQHEWLKPTTA